ncbi:MAG TPA: FMN-binding glutamate synthase family protein [Sunxiuqinia sp.]|nr:FMN-binding glutamate synthase family protein [Sunxiuqinia sp.]
MRKSITFTFFALFFLLIGLFLIEWTEFTLLTLAVLLIIVGFYDILQKKHTILRNFPVVGHARYLFEMIAPEIHQYFIESDTDGKPIDRNHRAYIYERSKLQNETHPFGTELDVELDNFKWLQHSIYPAKKLDTPPRVAVGGPDCKQPYSASLFNISAMSFGALSKNAIMALNKAAAAGDFFHDTGEGGISQYHLQGGDLAYEVGTGYFGCRTKDGHFSPGEFKKQAARKEVKMIELKLSQGAKPGHGGVLPASKNNDEIAQIRGVEPHTKVLSPPGHSVFNDAKGLLEFIQKLRDLSDGKPVGFKLSVGSLDEFKEICEKMVETGIKPDFITVDGAEGGTGAAPIDFSNYVGMPWELALAFVVDTLNGFDLKKDIRILTATKIFTAFDIFKALCLGADICNSARGMMLALGCIQALKCDTNECPTGVTTNKPGLMRGLVVEDKWKRVKNYQSETLKDFLELFAAAGCNSLDEPSRKLIFKQIKGKVKSYEELYPSIKPGSYLKKR